MRSCGSWHLFVYSTFLRSDLSCSINIHLHIYRETNEWMRHSAGYAKAFQHHFTFIYALVKARARRCYCCSSIDMKAVGRLTIENVAFVNKIYIFWVSSWLPRIRIATTGTRLGWLVRQTHHSYDFQRIFISSHYTLRVCVYRISSEMNQTLSAWSPWPMRCVYVF